MTAGRTEVGQFLHFVHSPVAFALVVVGRTAVELPLLESVLEVHLDCPELWFGSSLRRAANSGEPRSRASSPRHPSAPLPDCFVQILDVPGGKSPPLCLLRCF